MKNLYVLLFSVFTTSYCIADTNKSYDFFLTNKYAPLKTVNAALYAENANGVNPPAMSIGDALCKYRPLSVGPIIPNRCSFAGGAICIPKGNASPDLKTASISHVHTASTLLT